jgi:type I restriction enzyme, S subunit
MTIESSNLIDFLLNFESGKRPAGGAVDSGAPSLGGEHINADGTLKLNPMRFVPNDFFKTIKKGIIKKDDILVVKDGATTGRVGFVDQYFPYPEAAINEHVFLLRADLSKAYPKFLYYLLRSERGNAQLMTDFRGAAQGGITKGFVEKVLVPKYPLDNQRKIVEILSHAEEILFLRKKTFEINQRLIESIFLDMFGDISTNNKNWELKNFGSVVTNLDGKRRPIKSSDRDQRKGKYRYYGASGVIDSIDDYLFDGEYLLIAEDGANLLSRSTPLAFIAEGKFWVNNHAHVVSANGVANLIYLEQLLNFRGFDDAITGAAQPKLNQANLNKIMIPVPPTELQNIFSSRVQEIRAIIQKQRDLLAFAEKGFNSLLRTYFG